MKNKIPSSLKFIIAFAFSSLFLMQSKAQPVSCIANWYSNDSGNCTEYFYDISIGTNANTIYYWDFGDGQGSTLQNPTHVYAASGTYYVCHFIYDSTGTCYDSLCKNVTIQCGSTGNCTADWYSYDSASCIEYFYDNSSGTNSSTSYTWFFGDGQTSNQQNPVHTYSTSGTYSVCLAIVVPLFSGQTCTNTFCKNVTVQCGNGTNGISSSEIIDISLSVNNPVYESANIYYSIPSSGNIELVLFDIVGNKISVLENGNRSAGMHSYSFPATSFSKGIYFIHLNFEGIIVMKKIIIAE